MSTETHHFKFQIMAKFVAKKMTGGYYGDDGYYWKVVNSSTREVVARNLSKFDATVTRDEMNIKNRKTQ